MSKSLKWEYHKLYSIILVHSNSKNSIYITSAFCVIVLHIRHQRYATHISWVTICIHYFYLYTFTHYRWPLLIMMIITFFLCHWSIAMSSRTCTKRRHIAHLQAHAHIYWLFFCTLLLYTFVLFFCDLAFDMWSVALLPMAN